MNRIKMLAVVSFLAMIIGVNSCENSTVAPVLAIPPDCDTVNLTYTNGMQLNMDINCGTMNTGCHSSGSNHDLSSYAKLQRDATGGKTGRFWQEIFVQKKMPEYPELPLDDCASNQFRIWLLNGAPQ
jgi:hypothetical protein